MMIQHIPNHFHASTPLLQIKIQWSKSNLIKFALCNKKREYKLCCCHFCMILLVWIWFHEDSLDIKLTAELKQLVCIWQRQSKIWNPPNQVQGLSVCNTMYITRWNLWQWRSWLKLIILYKMMILYGNEMLIRWGDASWF